MGNKIIIQAGADIGRASAENDDEYLFEAFYSNAVMVDFRGESADKNIILGRTGAGKTAALRVIARQNDVSHQIDVYELSMTYLSNSDILAFLHNIGVDLALFFQYLWRHILLSRYIQERYGVDSNDKSERFWQGISKHFLRDAKKARALRYIEQWRDTFWIDTDEIVKEVTRRTEGQLEAEVGTEFKKFKSRGGLAYKISADKKAELVRRTQNIINPEQLQDTAKVLEALKDYSVGDKYGRRVYLLIDKLDENWIDETVRFRLIRGLIETVRVFRSVPNCRLVIALRTDVYERVIQETNDIGFQPDKYEDYFSRIRWTRDELKGVVNKRINLMARSRYTKDNVFFEDIFSSKVGQIDPFDYMIARTLYRPRDMIDYVNMALEASHGQASITARTIRQIEPSYSARRRDALIAEWSAALPSISPMLELLSRRRQRFPAAELLEEERWGNFLLAVSEVRAHQHDPVFAMVQNLTSPSSTASGGDVLALVVSELYRTGAIGVKISGVDRFQYAYRDTPVISPVLIDEESRVHIHEMLHAALSISHEG